MAHQCSQPYPYLFNDFSDLTLAGQLGSHKAAIHKIEFSPNGKYIASGDDRGNLVVSLGSGLETFILAVIHYNTVDQTDGQLEAYPHIQHRT
jgi:WD40 repeat protein